MKLKITIILFLFLSLSSKLFSQFSNSFDGNGNWNFKLNPKRYNAPSANDVWADTTVLGTSNATDSAILPRTGAKFWGMRDLDNPSGGSFTYHTIDFDRIDLKNYSSASVEFYYFSNGFDATDTLGYIVEFDSNATWNFSKFVKLPNNTRRWTRESISVPSGSKWVRLRLMTKQNGDADWAGWEDVKFTGSNVDLIPPVVKNVLMINPQTFHVIYSEKMSNTADSAQYYTGLGAVNKITRSINKLGDTAKIELSQAIQLGKYYTLTVSKNISDSSKNKMAADYNQVFVYNNSTPDLAITEIMYNFPSGDPDSLDYVEIINKGATNAAIGGLRFFNGQATQLPEKILIPGEFYLIGMDSAACRRFYKKSFAQYADALSNGGEALFIRNTNNVTLDSVNYDDAAPWPLGPPTPDGGGSSLEIIDYRLDNNTASNWRVSENSLGLWQTTPIFASPGAAQLPTIPSVDFSTNFQVVQETVDSATVTVRVSSSNNSPIAVKIKNIADFGTASSTADFVYDSTTLNIPAKTNGNFTFKLKIVNDTNAEPAENFAIAIASVSNGKVGANADQTIFIQTSDQKAIAPALNLQLSAKGRYSVGITGASAEISAYDENTQQLYVVNSLQNKLHIVNISNITTPTEVRAVDLTTYGAINSVAVKNGLVAVAVENAAKQNNGSVVFLDNKGNFIKQLSVGALPDMVCFTHDGKKVLTANEGEPSDDYTNDPDGTVSIIDLANGIANTAQTQVSTLNFAAFNGQETTLRAQGIRIYGKNATVSKDLEPEYITVSADNSTAWVSLQENNAIAEINLNSKSITALRGLGFKNYASVENSLDVSDNNGEILMANWPVKGIYQPDAIAYFKIGNTEYVATANEGDAREYNALTEEVRVSAMKLDSTVFKNQKLLKSSYNLGRLTAVNTLGDTDNDGDFDEIYTLGARSFTIFNAKTGALVWDSKNDLEKITANLPYARKLFNANNSVGLSLKNRSDNKGPEPEGIIVAKHFDTTYAFVAAERIGGIFVYNIQNPVSPRFVGYFATRDTVTGGGDLGPEGIVLIPAGLSPNGKTLVVLSNEISATVNIFELQGTYPPARTLAFKKSLDSIQENKGAAKIDLALNGPAYYETKLKIAAKYLNGLQKSEMFLGANAVNDTLTLSVKEGDVDFSIAPIVFDDNVEETTENLSLTILPGAFGLNPTGITTTVMEIKDNDKKVDLSAAQLLANHVKLYPNPSVGKVYFSKNCAYIIVYDVNGKQLLSSKNTNQIDISKLAAGIYEVKTNFGTGKIFKK